MQHTWIDDALDSVGARMRAAGRQPLGHRANGRAIWPIFGASEPPPAPPAPPAPPGPPSPPAPPAPPGPDPADRGFPANTPLEQMTGEQREAYWRFHARKHEDRVKELDNLTPEQLKELREKAGRADQLEYDLKSDTDKQVEDAKKAARAEAIAEALPEVIAATLDAAAARAGVSAEELKAAVEFIDNAKFLKPDGKVDPAKVTAFVQSIKPARGNNPKGPAVHGHGSGLHPHGSSGREKGKSEAERRFGKPA